MPLTRKERDDFVARGRGIKGPTGVDDIPIRHLAYASGMKLDNISNFVVTYNYPYYSTKRNYVTMQGEIIFATTKKEWDKWWSENGERVKVDARAQTLIYEREMREKRKLRGENRTKPPKQQLLEIVYIPGKAEPQVNLKERRACIKRRLLELIGPELIDTNYWDKLEQEP